MIHNPKGRIKLQDHSNRVSVRLDGVLIADTDQAVELTEKGYPDRQYLPRDALVAGTLQPSETVTVCPFKGQASYYHFVLADRVLQDAVWAYEEPVESMAPIAGRIVFDPAYFTQTVEATR
ncbi:MAG: DUF427 domain-containing protein [Natronospirillum sp.]|uniref:DUF427 domain-containing protein n=1 Tax=Natronospirillum sp. TaxID=2812955 RepID=UPI0025E71AED|nr:DUF427 domain-containing protein [Natronospirillum sp.]MCH8551906.1 DUF427 domain-containing protein [Natronospirillum sp.]